MLRKRYAPAWRKGIFIISHQVKRGISQLLYFSYSCRDRRPRLSIFIFYPSFSNKRNKSPSFYNLIFFWCYFFLGQSGTPVPTILNEFPLKHKSDGFPRRFFLPKYFLRRVKNYTHILHCRHRSSRTDGHNSYLRRTFSSFR